VLPTFLRVLLRIFFRRVEVAGGEFVPKEGPLLFVLNHQNGLVDAMVLLALAPRRSVFLAKAPLFRLPVVGLLVKAFGSIPIHRRIDGTTDAAPNADAFRNVWSALERGRAIAIFPEGTSHSDPELKPFKTGVARIALGASGVAAQGRPVQIVPAGLYYTTKTTFRSSVLLYFGRPIAVDPPVLGDGVEPSSMRVVELTAVLERALARVTLQADRHDALALVSRAERIFSAAASGARGETHLVNQFELRQSFVAGYAAFKAHAPHRLDDVVRMIAQYEAKLDAAVVSATTLMSADVGLMRVIWTALRTLGIVLVLLPVAVVGLALNYPAYRLVGPLATRVRKPDADVVATQKILVGAVLFPIVWGLMGWLVGAWLGVWAGIGATVLAPPSGYVAVRLLERVDYFIDEVRGFMLLASRPTMSWQLMAEGRAIRDAILTLGYDQATRWKT